MSACGDKNVKSDQHELPITIMSCQPYFLAMHELAIMDMSCQQCCSEIAKFMSYMSFPKAMKLGQSGRWCQVYLLVFF